MNADERGSLRSHCYLRLFAFICGCLFFQIASAQSPRLRDVPRERAAAAGVRRVEGRHLRLWTDLPASPAVDELPAVFDAAVPLWCEYFKIPGERAADWWVQGFLIRDRATFAALGLLPEAKPEFPNGFAQHNEIWWVEQQSDYYRRHLMLHEGTHAFMNEFLAGTGPGWYAEGMAELLGSHVWRRDEGRRGALQLPAFPASRDAVPMWGRVKVLRDAAAAGRSLPLEAVLALDGSRATTQTSYSWTWALCALLDNHPQFRERFRQLGAVAGAANFTADFNAQLRRTFAADWGDLACEWQAYAATIDYGYDFPRMAMQHREAIEIRGVGHDASYSTTVRADRGWQSTGALLRAGRTYRVQAAGRFVIAVEGKTPWPCEPGGVTLRWHAGRPLGELQAALRPSGDSQPTSNPSQAGSSPSPAPPQTTFAAPQPIGLAATITPVRDAVLYLRVNDSPAELDDNAGQVGVKILTAPE